MKPKKRWYRISLFKLLLLLTVVCVCLAGYAQIRKRAHAQQAAIKEFRKTVDSMYPYARYGYDYQMAAYDTLSKGMFAPQPSPHWLAGWFGVDVIHNVEVVEFQALASQELVNHLRNLPGLKIVIIDCGLGGQLAWNALMRCRQLEELHYDVYGHENLPIEFQNLDDLTRLSEFQIQNGDLNQAQLSEIAAAKSIKTLRLLDIHIKREELLNFPEMKQIESFFWKIYLNPLDNDEFRFVEKIPNVKKLAFAGHHELTDEAFRSIEKLFQLKELSFHGTNFTGSELHRLKNLSHLVKLELGASKLNDDGLAAITQLPQLKHLEIGSTDVTDEGMKHVASLTNLQHLSIRDTEVSDTGLHELEPLTNLRFLRIRDTKITDFGIAAFRENHPNCLVEMQ